MFPEMWKTKWWLFEFSQTIYTINKNEYFELLKFIPSQLNDIFHTRLLIRYEYSYSEKHIRAVKMSRPINRITTANLFWYQYVCGAMGINCELKIILQFYELIIKIQLKQIWCSIIIFILGDRRQRLEKKVFIFPTEIIAQYSDCHSIILQLFNVTDIFPSILFCSNRNLVDCFGENKNFQ